MASDVGQQRTRYPPTLPHNVRYHDYGVNRPRICDPLTGPPCFCIGREAFTYPNWVVHQLELERDELVAVLLSEREAYREGAQQSWEYIEMLSRERDDAHQEIERLRRQIQHHEERMHRVRIACEDTIVIEDSTEAGESATAQSVAPAPGPDVEHDAEDGAQDDAEADPEEDPEEDPIMDEVIRTPTA